MKELKRILEKDYFPLNKYFRYIRKQYLNQYDDTYLIQLNIPRFYELDKVEYDFIQKQAFKIYRGL